MSNIITLDQQPKPLLFDVYAEGAYHGNQKTEMFDIIEEPIYTAKKGVELGPQIPKKKALFVGQKCVNVVSDQYKVVQPSEIVKKFEETAGITTDKIILNPNTGGLLLSAQVATDNEHTHNLTFYTGHNGQYRTFLGLISLRLACFNQLPSLAGQQKDNYLVSAKHYHDNVVDSIGECLDLVPEIIAKFAEKTAEMKDKKITLAQFVELYIADKKIKEDQKNKDKLINDLKGVYANAQGQALCANDSAYKAYQAITYINTHNIRDSLNKLETQYINKPKDSFKWYDLLLAA